MAEAAEWRGKTPDELQDALVKLKKEQFNLRFQKANGQLENTSRPREVRRDIARIMTVSVERAKHPEAVPAVAAKPAKAAKEKAPKAEKAAAKPAAKKPAKKPAKKK